MEIKQNLGIEIISPNMEQALSSHIDQANISPPHYRVRELPRKLQPPLSISPIRAFSPPLPSLMALALLFLRH
jgi:hypothetical protein